MRCRGPGSNRGPIALPRFWTISSSSCKSLRLEAGASPTPLSGRLLPFGIVSTPSRLSFSKLWRVWLGIVLREEFPRIHPLCYPPCGGKARRFRRALYQLSYLGGFSIVTHILLCFKISFRCPSGYLRADRLDSPRRGYSQHPPLHRHKCSGLAPHRAG